MAGLFVIHADLTEIRRENDFARVKHVGFLCARVGLEEFASKSRRKIAESLKRFDFGFFSAAATLLAVDLRE